MIRAWIRAWIIMDPCRALKPWARHRTCSLHGLDHVHHFPWGLHRRCHRRLDLEGLVVPCSVGECKCNCQSECKHDVIMKVNIYIYIYLFIYLHLHSFTSVLVPLCFYHGDIEIRHQRPTMALRRQQLFSSACYSWGLLAGGCPW